MTRVNVPIEMNEDLYDKMQELCEELGLDMDTASWKMRNIHLTP